MFWRHSAPLMRGRKMAALQRARELRSKPDLPKPRLWVHSEEASTRCLLRRAFRLLRNRPGPPASLGAVCLCSDLSAWRMGPGSRVTPDGPVSPRPTWPVARRDPVDIYKGLPASSSSLMGAVTMWLPMCLLWAQRTR